MVEAGLSKRYGSVEAVSDVSFSVGDGQIVGLLGRSNGAGKTTIMRILAAFHYPTPSGDARVDGYSVASSPLEVRKLVGYVPENVPLYGDSKVGEYLEFVASARDLRGAKRRQRLEKTFSDCGIVDVLGKRIDELSKGYRQRVGIAQAILHEPRVLILDEPTTGLDPNQILEIRSLIRAFGENTTVILSTHILQEVEVLCPSVIIVHAGRIAAQGTIEELSSLAGGEGSSVVYEINVKGVAVPEAARRFAAIPGFVSASDIKALSPGAVSAVLTLSSAGCGDEGLVPELIFNWAITSGLTLLALNKRRGRLEDVFAKITAGKDAK